MSNSSKIVKVLPEKVTDRKRLRTMQSILQNVVLSLLSISFVLSMGEIGLRISGFQPGNPFERLINHYDSRLGYRMVPGMREHIKGPDGIYLVEIRSLGFEDDIGFRDDGVTQPVFSIFLGDSFVWGFGVDLADSVSEQFEQLTGKDSVNLGMTSWTSPTQYSRLFATHGYKIAPQYAFVGFFLGNDFRDVRNFSEWEIGEKKQSYPEWLTIQSKKYTPNKFSYKIRRFLYTHSSFYSYLSDRVNFGLDAWSSRDVSQTVHIKTETLDLLLNKTQLLLELDPESSQEATMVRASLNEIKKTGLRRNIKTIVFIIPTKEMVYQSRFPSSELKSAVDVRYTLLLNILNDVGITHIDLLSKFRRAASHGEQLYFKTDGHWNAKGHLLAATAIRDFLTMNGDD